MKRIVIVTGLVFFTQIVIAQADSILNRYNQYLFASLHVRNDVDQLAASLNSDGQWEDINYIDLERGNWQPLHHIKRVRDMAFAYAFPASKWYHHKKLLQKINLAVDNWVRKKYVCPNWWHNEIGVPQVARDIAILLRTTLADQQMQNVLTILAQYKIRDDASGANLVWDADLGLHYGLLTDNAALVQKCRDLVVKEIMITEKDGVQPDYSFHQHGSRLQMYQYGGAFLFENVRLAWELRGTTFAFPQDKIDLLADFVLQGWQWMTRGINSVPGTMDRSASRKDALHSSDIRSLIPYLVDLIPEKKSALLTVALHQNADGALSGFRYFPYSDFAAYQQKDFSFFLKYISSRTLATESINSENLKGHLLNSGDGYFIRDGNEYFNLMPVWNWEMLPGITSFDGSDKMKRKDFAGSIADGKAGFTSMKYELENKDGSCSISASKSWFCYNNKVVSLVGDLTGRQVDAAYTVLDQSRWQATVFANKINHRLSEGDHRFSRLRWIQHNGLAYTALTGPKAEIRLRTVKGKWSDINTSESDAVVEEKVFLPLLIHDNLAAGTSFGYLVTASQSAGEAKRLYKHPGLEIIRNDSLCQAVQFEDGTLMAAFFKAGDLGNKLALSVDQPCLLMIHDNMLYASDPMQKSSTVAIRYKGQDWKIELPGDGSTHSGIHIQ
jgi:chondroitin AC lyase